MKSIFVVAIILIVVLVTGITFLSPPNENANGMDNVNVRLKWIHQAQFAGFHTAEQMGFYEQNRILAHC